MTLLRVTFLQTARPGINNNNLFSCRSHLFQFAVIKLRRLLRSVFITLLFVYYVEVLLSSDFTQPTIVVCCWVFVSDSFCTARALTSAKNAMISSALVRQFSLIQSVSQSVSQSLGQSMCLITAVAPKPLDRFSQNSVQRWYMGHGKNYQILMVLPALV